MQQIIKGRRLNWALNCYLLSPNVAPCVQNMWKQAAKEEDAHNKLSRCNLQREQQQQHKHSYIPFKYIINV